MRISIREQFSLLVLLVSLIALMVLALAVVRLNFLRRERNSDDAQQWFQSHGFIVSVG
jgi:hypothetical protein